MSEQDNVMNCYVWCRAMRPHLVWLPQHEVREGDKEDMRKRQLSTPCHTLLFTCINVSAHVECLASSWWVGSYKGKTLWEGMCSVAVISIMLAQWCLPGLVFCRGSFKRARFGYLSTWRCFGTTKILKECNFKNLNSRLRGYLGVTWIIDFQVTKETAWKP